MWIHSSDGQTFYFGAQRLINMSIGPIEAKSNPTDIEVVFVSFDIVPIDNAQGGVGGGRLCLRIPVEDARRWLGYPK